MRLHLILPGVDPGHTPRPTCCPHCGGKYFRLHQKEVVKPLRDTRHEQVTVQRYRCMGCQRTWRAYPRGVTREQVSQRVKGLAVMLYLLGLSYGAVALVLEALGVYMCKSRVYDAVQAAARRVPGMQKSTLLEGVQTPAVGGDLTSVRCNGRWLTLGLSVDDLTGLVLTVDELSAEDSKTLQEWLAPIAEVVGAQLLVSDDADAFKHVADELGLAHQLCKSHVRRSTEAQVEQVAPLAVQDADGSLTGIGVTPEQAVADLQRLNELVRTRQPEAVAELEMMHQRYAQAAAPRVGQKATLAYRLRLLFLDRWNLWPRLTCYRDWEGPHGERVDGTNNACERAIGWWIKERYRTMRGYKREDNAVAVSRLLAWCGNHLNCGGADLSPLVA